MPVEVIMPQMGESVVEGTVVKWLKQEGEKVEADEPLVVISTEKIDTEIPSPASGVVAKILAQAGETVPVEQAIALIDAEGEIAPSRLREPEAAAAPPTTPPRPEVRERAYSPVVTRLAVELGVDLAQVPGTGSGGRVTKSDLLAFVERAKPLPTAPQEGEEVIPLVGMRKTMAEHMHRSRQTAAHATTVALVDMSKVVDWRERNKEQFLQREGIRLTYLPFIADATIRAIRDFPLLNSSLVEDRIVVKHYVHLGIAVAPDDGLIVPVIHNAHALAFPALARAIEQVAERARSGKLAVEDVQGGTFTITNPGVFGAILSTPIINQPQAAILSSEAITKMPVVVGDAVAIRSTMYLCLSYDHRIVDGATAVRFLQHIRHILEAFDFSL